MKCPACGREVQYFIKTSDKTVKCPLCGTEINVQRLPKDAPILDPNRREEKSEKQVTVPEPEVKDVCTILGEVLERNGIERGLIEFLVRKCETFGYMDPMTLYYFLRNVKAGNKKITEPIIMMIVQEYVAELEKHRLRREELEAFPPNIMMFSSGGMGFMPMFWGGRSSEMMMIQAMMQMMMEMNRRYENLIQELTRRKEEETIRMIREELEELRRRIEEEDRRDSILINEIKKRDRLLKRIVQELNSVRSYAVNRPQVVVSKGEYKDDLYRFLSDMIDRLRLTERRPVKEIKDLLVTILPALLGEEDQKKIIQKKLEKCEEKDNITSMIEEMGGEVE